MGQALPRGGVPGDNRAEQITRQVLDSLPSLGVQLENLSMPPIRRSASSSKSETGTGNAEWLALLTPAATSPVQREPRTKQAAGRSGGS